MMLGMIMHFKREGRVMELRCRIMLVIGLLMLLGGVGSGVGVGEVWGQERSQDRSPLAGTKMLAMEGDIASELVSGVDRFLLKQLEKSKAGRLGKFDFTKTEKGPRNNLEVPTLTENRERLKQMLGIRDKRHEEIELELVGTVERAALVAEAENYKVYTVRWKVFGDVYGEGLLLEPKKKAWGNVIAIPDCDMTPEEWVGLVEGVDEASQFPRRVAGWGARVIVPMLINREEKIHKITNREWLYRSAFELGRTLPGYEVQKVLAMVDWMKQSYPETAIGVMGHGEGGMIALYAGALDLRITTVGVSGYFGSRQAMWEGPIDRNVFGLLNEFGDGELARMIVPRTLMIQTMDAEEVVVRGGRGAPFKVVWAKMDEVKSELERVGLKVETEGEGPKKLIVSESDGVISFGFHKGERYPSVEMGGELKIYHGGVDVGARHARQMHELDRHNQWLLRESAYVRKGFYKPDMSSVEKFENSNEKYRKLFYEEVIGKFDLEALPFNARTRKTYETEKWVGYEVVLDVYEDVIAYGLLLVPKGIKDGEKRPVVVCQHGLEGRPEDLIGEKGYQYYKGFAGQLAERGFVTFAPQNLYIFGDRFRTLQRKANPLGKTLFSVIVPQHQQIVDWLETLEFVDGERIGFYGLSYGGKSAMRIPPLVKEYKLSICSADFNEWVDKNASTRSPYSYVWTGEYEIFEFDLGSRFNYAEMAGLIAPRAFMVERGHFDGVGSDEQVAYEFAKVRHLYQAKLGIGDRCEIEWFVGPHTINGKGTFDFLHKHLEWAKPK